VVAMFGTAAQAGNFNVRRFAAFAGANRHEGFAAVSNARSRGGIDPILQGADSQTVPGGFTQYFFAASNALSVKDCSSVEVTHADGNAFDPNNTGQLLDLGLDVVLVIFDKNDNPIGGAFVAAASPNGVLHSAGYAATSPQSVQIQLKDVSGDPNYVQMLVEGDVANMDTKPHDVGSTVEGIITLHGCPH
jgi:hypothetical protein